MPKKELVRRYVVFMVSLFIQAFAVALLQKSGLGLSPIPGVPNVLNCRFPFVSLGMWSFLWNCVFVLAQILLRKSHFSMVQLMQIPLSLVFGVFIDISVKLLSWLSPQAYFLRISVLLAGIVLSAIAVSLSVMANVVMNSGEALTKAISDRFNISFEKTKIGFDCSCVLLTVALSVFLLNGRIVGLREGTVLSAVLAGVFVPPMRRALSGVERWICSF